MSEVEYSKKVNSNLGNNENNKNTNSDMKENEHTNNATSNVNKNALSKKTNSDFSNEHMNTDSNIDEDESIQRPNSSVNENQSECSYDENIKIKVEQLEYWFKEGLDALSAYPVNNPTELANEETQVKTKKRKKKKLGEASFDDSSSSTVNLESDAKRKRIETNVDEAEFETSSHHSSKPIYIGGHNGQVLSVKSARKLYTFLENAIIEITPPDQMPQFYKTEEVDGRLKLFCANSKSYDWVYSTINAGDRWKAGSLAQLENPIRKKYIVEVTRGIDFKTFITYIKGQNPGFDDTQIHLRHTADRANCTIFHVLLDNPMICFLNERNYRLYFRLGQITFRIANDSEVLYKTKKNKTIENNNK